MLLQFRRRHGKSHSARMQTHSTCCSDGPLPESEWLDLRVGVPEDWASISLPGIHSRSILVALSAKRNCVMRWLTRWDIAGSRDRRRSSPLSGKECRRSVIRRSEEHTSELQSRRDLVCRLLLEKKKRLRWSPYPVRGAALLTFSQAVPQVGSPAMSSAGSTSARPVRRSPPSAVFPSVTLCRSCS